jgi:hypothetical protein
MYTHKSTKVLLVLIAFLLIANLARPLLEPGTAFAEKEEQHAKIVAIPGSTGWVIKENMVYYLKYERQSDRIWIHTEELR